MTTLADIAQVKRGIAGGRDGFTIYELTAGIAILIVLSVCFYGALKGVYLVQDKCRLETNAIVMMNNLVCRLRAEKALDAAKVRKVAEDEFVKWGLGEQGMSLVCEDANDRIIAGVRGASGRIWSSIEVMK